MLNCRPWLVIVLLLVETSEGWPFLVQCLRLPLLLCLAAQAALGQDAPPKPEGRVSISVQSASIRRHKVGAWSALGVTVNNSTDEDAEALAASYFAPNVSQQFARRLWVPAHARRVSWLPMRVPADVPKTAEHLELTTFSLEVAGGREVLRRRETDPLKSDVFVTIDHNDWKTGFIGRSPLRGDDGGMTDLDDDSLETLLTAKTSVDLPHIASNLEGNFLPPWSDALEGFDQIGLIGDRIVNDAAGLVSLRSWVRDGGRLWIMLDGVDPSTVAALLGNAVDFQTVDRVELDRFELEPSPEVRSTEDKVVVHEYETPVDFLRVVTSAQDIVYRIDGWPAAFRMPYGDGEILFTTLAARGWRDEASGAATPELEHLAVRFFALRQPPLDPPQLRPYLEERIGYRVPPRSLAVLVLGGYCASLLGASLVLARGGRLDWLAWIVPAITLTAAGIFYAVGITNTNTVPPSVASLQLLRFASQTNEVRVQGLAAIYDQQSRDVQWQGLQRAWVIPEPGDDSEVKRLVWRGDDAMQTENARTHSGSVGLASLKTTRTTSQPVRAFAQFGPDGLVGQLSSGELQDAVDVVVVAPPGPSLAVKLNRDGSFVGGVDDVLAAQQYLADALLSDEQRRRQEVFRLLFDPSEQRTFGGQEYLALWCRPIEAGVAFPEGFEVSESALALVPLQLQRTPPQKPFSIPATFLRVDQATSGEHGGTSSAYQPKTGQWLKRLTLPTETDLRFQLPQQVLPCDLKQGNLAIRINAPSRKLTVWAVGGSTPIQIGEVANPNGVRDFTLNADQLAQDEHGGVTIRVVVSAAQLEGDTQAGSDFARSTWQIDYVRLSVGGQTH